MNRSEVRPLMIEAAARLLATKGLEGTSFAHVLAATGGPRGSVYHHFPGGKAELVHAALELASSRGIAAMEAARGQSPEIVAEVYLSLWRQLLDKTQLLVGCAVLAVTVAADDPALLEHAGDIFKAWTQRLSELLVAGGMAAERATSLATLLVAAVEGAVVLCRAQGSREPFDRVSDMLVQAAKA